MIRLISLSACFAVTACATEVTPPPVVPPIITGCQQQLQLPVCAPQKPIPEFTKGMTARDMAIAYDADLKPRILQLEACIVATRKAANDFREACNAQ